MERAIDKQPYACTIRKCGFRTHYKQNLGRHYKLKHGVEGKIKGKIEASHQKANDYDASSEDIPSNYEEQEGSKINKETNHALVIVHKNSIKKKRTNKSSNEKKNQDSQKKSKKNDDETLAIENHTVRSIDLQVYKEGIKLGRLASFEMQSDSLEGIRTKVFKLQLKHIIFLKKKRRNLFWSGKDTKLEGQKKKRLSST